MKIKINIGLTTNDGKPVALHKAVSLAKIIGDIEASYYHKGQDEDCLSLEITPCGDKLKTVIRLNEVCRQLSQDCIAVIWANGHGALIGPNAEKWGEFDPEFFVDPVNPPAQESTADYDYLIQLEKL